MTLSSPAPTEKKIARKRTPRKAKPRVEVELPAEPTPDLPPPPVTVVVPWRHTADRAQAWEWLQNRWAEAHPDWQVVAGTCGTKSWCKSRAVADGVSRAKADILVVADADVWCDGVTAAVAAVKAGAAWAIPHYRVLRLTKPSTAEVLATGHWPTRRQPTTYAQRPYPGRPGGGMVVLTKAAYASVPIDPRFVGWGQEDESWALALGTMLGNSWRGTADLWHLWHEPMVRQSRAIGSAASLALHRRYVRAMRNKPRMSALMGEIFKEAG